MRDNGRYRLVFQGDGNLVLYEGGHPWWSTKTDRQPTTQCIMQTDGKSGDLRIAGPRDLGLEDSGQPR